MRGLTQREVLFVCAYVGNAAAAARAAGYSEKMADRHAYDIMRRPHVAAAIELKVKAQLQEIAHQGTKQVQSLLDAYAAEDIDTRRCARLMNAAIAKAQQELESAEAPLSRAVVSLLALLHGLYGPPKGLSQTGGDDGRYITGLRFDYVPEWAQRKAAEVFGQRGLPAPPVIDGNTGT